MIPITRPFLGEEEAAAAREVILSGWVTQGPKVKEFEEAFASTVGTSFACAVSSCTTALHLALLAVGVRPGDIVITVSHSFIATANAVRYCGAEPVFVDIDPETFNINPEGLQRVLHDDCVHKDGKPYYKYIKRIAVGESPLRFLSSNPENRSPNLGRVAAVLPVHQMGFPCDIFRIVQIAKKYCLPVIEDAACAIGSKISLNGVKNFGRIGKPHGDIACFSFHPRKVLTTGDGGMITTNNPAFDAKFRLLRQHGMSVPDTLRHYSKKVMFEEYKTTGFNYRMTDIQAAIGIEQLKKLDKILDERRKLAALYSELLKDIPYLKSFNKMNTVLPNWQSYPVRLLDVSTMSQMEIMQKLLDKGIATRRGIMNAHQEPCYLEANYILPQSEATRDHIILLPLYTGMTKEKARDVCKALKSLYHF